MASTLRSAEHETPLLDLARRDACLHALGAHHAAGRLSTHELDSRIQSALAAQTLDELEALTTDLEAPDESPPAETLDDHPVDRRPAPTQLSRPVSACLAALAGGGVVTAVAPQADTAGFGAGVAAGLVGYLAHWVMMRGTEA